MTSEFSRIVQKVVFGHLGYNDSIIDSKYFYDRAHDTFVFAVIIDKYSQNY